MKKIGQVIALALVGLIVGTIIGEFFPKLFTSGIVSSIGNAVSEPFSRYRNELAMKYGLFGAGIGAVLGVISMLIGKK
jgi:uncharacterized protein YqgC (DUF456 family)